MASALPELLLLLAVAPALAASLYLGLLAASSRCPRRSPPLPAAAMRFAVVVPAHDEEHGIARTVHNLRSLDYPASLRRIVVVADNCTDATASRSRAAGAAVIVRTDPARRGKGHALAFAFERILAERWADAIAVVDADTIVSRNLLRAFQGRLAAGAAAVQAHYGVLNASATWRTRLLALAFSSFHLVRSLGRERLALSVGLRGNGMCFSTALLRAVPHDSFSPVEDVEYGLRLGLAGVRVHYAAEAAVWGEMAEGGRAARTQRARWEDGRAHLRRVHAARLLRLGVARRDRVLLDLGIDLLVPPLSALVASLAAAGAVAALLSLFAAPPLIALSAVAVGLLAILTYVLRGWWLSGSGVEGLAALLWAPGYVAWKLFVALRPRRPAGWVRTRRRWEAGG